MLLFQRRAVSSLHGLCVVQEALKSIGCHGDERQEQKELSTSPKQIHTNTRTNRQQTLTKSDVGLFNALYF